jgi:hypothetical protein
MIDPTEYPWLFAGIVLLSIPIYRGLAVAVFGTPTKFQSAVRYWSQSSTWIPSEDDDINLEAETKMCLLVILCMAFVAAVYDTCVRYFV